MIDSIFNKIYKHKRYLTINESFNEDVQNAENVKDYFKNFKNIIQSYIDNNHSIPLAINGNRLVFYKTFTPINEIIEPNKNIEDVVTNLATEVFQKNGVKIDSNNEITLHTLTKRGGQIVNIIPSTRLVIDTSTLKTWNDAPVFYKRGSMTIDQSYIQNLYKKYYIRETSIDEVFNMLDEAENHYIDFLNYQEQINTNSNKKEDIKLKPQNITFDESPNSGNALTLVCPKNSNDIVFRLYTSQLITDSKPRNIKTCTNMILNSCKNLKIKLESSDSSTKNTAFKFSKDESSTSSVTNLPRSYNVIKNNSPEENNKVLNNAYNVVNIYEEAVNKAYNNDYTSDFTNSQGQNMSIQVYLPEILSPYALIYNACTWASLGNQNGFKTLQSIVGNTGNDFLNVPCYIGFYDLSNQPLADSYAWINGKFVDISTKAGLNGKGASASIESLRKFIFKSDISDRTITTNELSPKGLQVKHFYPLEFEIFDELSTNQLATPETVRQILIKHHLWNPHEPLSDKKGGKQINDFLKRETKFTDFVMEILQSASYDFVQMNCKPTSNTKDFHFTYQCQYPAIFDGTVDITFTAAGKGFTKFHIV